MAEKLDGKVAVITGGASGIGEAAAKIYAKNGCKVALCDIDAERLARVAGEITADGGDCMSKYVDVSKEEEVVDFFHDVKERWGRLDLVVNSAGIDSLSPPLSEVTYEEWKKILATNLDGVFLCCREAFRIMEPQGTGGRIINVGSSSARLASSPGHSPYRASKHGMMGFSKNILLDGAKHNIAVTVLNPSHVKTPMTDIISTGISSAGFPAYLEGWLTEEEMKNGIHASCIDVDNVAEAALYIATRPLDVIIPHFSLYPSHKVHTYGMEL